MGAELPRLTPNLSLAKTRADDLRHGSVLSLDSSLLNAKRTSLGLNTGTRRGATTRNMAEPLLQFFSLMDAQGGVIVKGR